MLQAEKQSLAKQAAGEGKAEAKASPPPLTPNSFQSHARGPRSILLLLHTLHWPRGVCMFAAQRIEAAACLHTWPWCPQLCSYSLRQMTQAVLLSCSYQRECRTRATCTCSRCGPHSICRALPALPATNTKALLAFHDVLLAV